MARADCGCTGWIPFADKSRETGNSQSKKQGQKER
jgi:hypothetical protein